MWRTVECGWGDVNGKIENDVTVRELWLSLLSFLGGFAPCVVPAAHEARGGRAHAANVQQFVNGYH